MLSAERGIVGVNETLLKHRSDASTMDNLDWNVIHSACQGQHLSIPRSLGRSNIHWNVNVNAKLLSEWFYDMTVLHMALSLSDSQSK